MGTFIMNLIYLDLITKVRFAILIRYIEFWNLTQIFIHIGHPSPSHSDRIHSFGLDNKQVPGNYLTDFVEPIDVDIFL